MCLYPLALLLLAAPLLAQDTPTPDATTTTAVTVEAGTTAPVDATGTFVAGTTATAVAVTSTAATVASTGTAAVVNATSTAAANATGTVAAATSTTLAAPPLLQPTATPQPTAALPPTPTPTAATGGLGDRLAPLLIGGLFLLAALAIGGLLLTRRRRPRPPVAAPPAQGRPVAPPPPIGAETVTGVLMPVYLQLEGDAPQSFAINETPFAIGRDPANNLPIDETFPGWQTVSRHHALISRHERGYVIEDLGSQNGVRVNGRLTPKNLLRSGWQVSVGGVTFRFVDETQTN